MNLPSTAASGHPLPDVGCAIGQLSLWVNSGNMAPQLRILGTTRSTLFSGGTRAIVSSRSATVLEIGKLVNQGRRMYPQALFLIVIIRSLQTGCNTCQSLRVEYSL